jgi:hypothetical protein
MKKLPKAPTVRMPGLHIEVSQAINGGSRLSAMAAVTPPANGHPHTLEGSVRGAKPSEEVSEAASRSSGTNRHGRPKSSIVKAVLRTTRDSW